MLRDVVALLMPEFPLLLFVAVLVVGIVLLLHRDRHPVEGDYRPGMDVQNHLGDE